MVVRDVLALHEGRLARDLRGDLVVRETRGGEKRELLAYEEPDNFRIYHKIS